MADYTKAKSGPELRCNNILLLKQQSICYSMDNRKGVIEYLADTSKATGARAPSL